MKQQDSASLAVHELVKNLDYSLRLSGASRVLIASDKQGEGKSTFAENCLPLLSEIYKRKVLFITDQSANAIEGIDNLSSKDFAFLTGLKKEESQAQREAYMIELSKNYDVVFVDSSTLKRAEKTRLPKIIVDGAILVRSSSTVGSKRKPVTEEILDKEIPVIGIVYNEA
ncbi:MAG: Mrp family chromosome partitioning ATPase [Bacteriovoracaceae bacterium]|jgi:Mrp family chromosome partitioning ATPase